MRRAKHNLSHYKITAGDFGLLYPFSALEVLPGDTFRASSSALVRLQPLMTPLMHPVHIRIHHWFVPNRLVWDDWEAFITGRKVVPIPTNDSSESTVLDYMGVPPGNLAVNGLPVRAYNLIYNEFYRDQDLAPEAGEDDVVIQRTAWEKDYFTTARTYAQSGELGESATIVFAQDLPISGIGMTGKDTGVPAKIFQSDKTEATIPAASNPPRTEQTPDGFPNVRVKAGTIAGGVDINEWRRAMAMQRFREHRNRYGSRYADYLRYLGVRPADGRLDRPEYLGGGRQTIAFSEVLATSEDTVNSIPLGAQAGHGIAAIRTRPWRRFFAEHGHVISILSIRPKAIYTHATHRSFLRTAAGDYWQKENEALGEQGIWNKEIWKDGNREMFGFQQRHDDYRSHPSGVTGPMRKTAYNTWHMAREFSAQPTLNPSFIDCNPTKRVFRSQNDPQFYAMVQNRVAARRLVSREARI